MTTYIFVFRRYIHAIQKSNRGKGWKKKFDRHRIEWDRSMEDQMDWSRDGRKKRIYTYVQTQRKYDVQFQRLYTYLNMQNCYELIPTSRASKGRQVFLYKVQLHYWYYSLRQSTSHPVLRSPILDWRCIFYYDKIQQHIWNVISIARSK